MKANGLGGQITVYLGFHETGECLPYPQTFLTVKYHEMKSLRVLVLAIIVTFIIYDTFSVYEHEQVPESVPRVFTNTQYEPSEIGIMTALISTETSSATVTTATAATESVCANPKTNGFLMSFSDISSLQVQGPDHYSKDVSAAQPR